MGRRTSLTDDVSCSEMENKCLCVSLFAEVTADWRACLPLNRVTSLLWFTKHIFGNSSAIRSEFLHFISQTMLRCDESVICCHILCETNILATLAARQLFSGDLEARLGYFITTDTVVSLN